MIRYRLFSRLLRSDTNSYYKVLYLLAACQKYEMTSVQSFIRTEVKRGEFPAPNGVEAYPAYAIASRRGLIPEMENAGRQTLNHPMTFEVLGEGLRLFEGWALSALVSFRKRCKDCLIACLDSYLVPQSPGPSSIWVGCPEVTPDRASYRVYRPYPLLPMWLDFLILQNRDDLKFQNFTYPLDIDSRMPGEYLNALQTHLDCKFCLMVHAVKGLKYCAELTDKLAEVGDKLTRFLYLSSVTRFTSCRYAAIAALSLD
jgi:hypothetical protein